MADYKHQKLCRTKNCFNLHAYRPTIEKNWKKNNTKGAKALEACLKDTTKM